jgi:hypothetical protein
MARLIWRMRTVGVFYLFLFVAASFLHLPIEAEGPEGVLEHAAVGDLIARFVVDTWLSWDFSLVSLGVPC